MSWSSFWKVLFCGFFCMQLHVVCLVLVFVRQCVVLLWVRVYCLYLLCQRSRCCKGWCCVLGALYGVFGLLSLFPCRCVLWYGVSVFSLSCLCMIVCKFRTLFCIWPVIARVCLWCCLYGNICLISFGDLNATLSSTSNVLLTSLVSLLANASTLLLL